MAFINFFVCEMIKIIKNTNGNFKTDNIFQSSKSLKAFMKSNGVAFNKRLGQNFLMNGAVLKKIVRKADVVGCGVLEVGAGLGNLTEVLVNSAMKVVAVEFDSGLFKILKNRFEGVQNLVLVNADVLKLNLKQLFAVEFDGMAVKICANLPYYITSRFVANVLEQRLNLRSITIMVQREAAIRLCATPGSSNCSAISCLVNYYSEPSIWFDVPSHCFYPVPKVASCVINLKLKLAGNGLEIDDEFMFFKFIKIAFSERRKIIAMPLSKRLNLDKNKLKEFLVSKGLKMNLRAQELSLEQFAILYREVTMNLERLK